MEILRVSVLILPYILPHACFQENRLAQLATVDQQRELMRYMRGLNEWLERDVYDRQNEIQGVLARVEQLSDDIRGIRAQGKDF
jgi:predicted  nucleic acid-binding Zn-ribbon protein